MCDLDYSPKLLTVEIIEMGNLSTSIIRQPEAWKERTKWSPLESTTPELVEHSVEVGVVDFLGILEKGTADSSIQASLPKRI